jgi:hypothetical protein
MTRAAAEQPLPTHSAGPDITSLVRDDLELRAQKGEAVYGQRLRPHIGRNALLDAYQEALDLSVYLKQRMIEEDAFLRQLDTAIASAEAAGSLEFAGLVAAKQLYVRLLGSIEEK